MTKRERLDAARNAAKQYATISELIAWDTGYRRWKRWLDESMDIPTEELRSFKDWLNWRLEEGEFTQEEIDETIEIFKDLTVEGK